jgi:hypothetical protein
VTTLAFCIHHIPSAFRLFHQSRAGERGKASNAKVILRSFLSVLVIVIVCRASEHRPPGNPREIVLVLADCRTVRGRAIIAAL